MNWQKITIWTLVLSVIIYFVFYYVSSNIDKFCFPDHYECLEKLKFGISYPIVILSRYFIFCCLLIVVLPTRYKKTLYLICLILNIFAVGSTFLLLPDTCSGFVCFYKAEGARMIQPLYPIILIPTLAIMFIRFTIKDRKALASIILNK